MRCEYRTYLHQGSWTVTESRENLRNLTKLSNSKITTRQKKNKKKYPIIPVVGSSIIPVSYLREPSVVILSRKPKAGTPITITTTTATQPNFHFTPFPSFSPSPLAPLLEYKHTSKQKKKIQFCKRIRHVSTTSQPKHKSDRSTFPQQVTPARICIFFPSFWLCMMRE
ncbi:hypothetical protein B9Z19DRAFT_581181 [Tuber borchii]|uniref:Uncharacterized protein n=1 Tax=Tuber borchii TaxID=42251 RepID=A0A2T7A1M5_TUBBO|nr:hypothetical protein B9Z19DRAFT_581181 [Tuber borchii]